MRRNELLNAIGARISRYTQTGDPRLIVDPAAVREADELLALVPDLSRDVDVCHTVGGLFWCRWGVLGNGQSTPDFTRTVDLMIHVHREWPEKVPEMLAELFDAGGFTTGALRAGAASKEGDRLFEEYQQTGNRAALDQAIEYLREAAHSPHTDPERTLYNAMGFSLALHQVLQLDGDPEVAGELISWLYSVLSDDPPNAPSFMGLLVSALTRRYAATRDARSLDEAVSVGRMLFDSTQDPMLRGTVCTSAGIWLQHNENSAEAGVVAELALACLASVPRDHRDRPAHVHSVFIGVVAALTQVPALLERALELYHESASGGPSYWSAVDALATQLGHRFRATDHKTDVDEAIALGREVVAAQPDALYRNNLAAWLLERCQLTSDITDLHEGVDMLRAAVADSPADAGLVTNLAKALELKYHRTGEFAALDEAQALYRRAASL